MFQDFSPVLHFFLFFYLVLGFVYFCFYFFVIDIVSVFSQCSYLDVSIIFLNVGHNYAISRFNFPLVGLIFHCRYLPSVCYRDVPNVHKYLLLGHLIFVFNLISFRY